MGLLLDSAKIEEVRQAVELGFVAGVTTNPTIMAKAKGEPKEIIRQICAIAPGPVFYQVTAKTVAEREREGREFFSISPEKVVLKIPATTENMALMVRLSGEIPCAATAVYSGYQTLVACEAGARYVIPYVNRTTRLLGDGCKLVAEMAAVIRATGKRAQILAASIKTAEEAAQAVLAGANHLTLPMDILLSLGNHPLSDAAIEEFSRAATQANSEVRS
ncbi:MAG: transaldolase [candidate division WOR-3 bacterium]|nr:transaldolase [candidate division WOR-3 bacterium]